MARERALAGEGPTLIEAVTMRMHGHAAHDDMKYVPDREGRGVARARTRSTARSKRLEALGVDTQAIRDEVKATIDAAVERGAAVADARRRHRHSTACSPTSRRCSRTATPPGRGFKA